MITLYSINRSETLILPNELIWVDEIQWSNVKANLQYSIEGDMIIEYSQTSKGRPITLQGDNALIKREDVLTLYNWVNEINHIMELTLHDNRKFDVVFRYWEEPLEAKVPFEGYSKPEDGNYYTLTLRMLQI